MRKTLRRQLSCARVELLESVRTTVFRATDLVKFVTRAKDTMRYEVVEQNFNIDETTGLRTDKTIRLTVAKSKKLYPEELRLVEFFDDTNSELLVFLTNNFDVSALEVANLYRNRWQIEVFLNG